MNNLMQVKVVLDPEKCPKYFDETSYVFKYFLDGIEGRSPINIVCFYFEYAPETIVEDYTKALHRLAGTVGIKTITIS